MSELRPVPADWPRPTVSRAHHGGTQYEFAFPNGYGASVVSHAYSYGGGEGLWELAVLGASGALCYSTPITSDVLGWLDDGAVVEALTKIEALPAAKPSPGADPVVTETPGKAGNPHDD